MMFVKVLLWLLFVAILFGLDYFVKQYFPILLNSPYGELISLFKTVYIMLLVLGLLMLWVIYYLNLQVVTNERVVDIDQYSLLHHKISEVYLSRMQDVTAEIKGIFPTFFNYGNVHIQTAGETERFVFSNIPNPAAMAKLISDLYEKLPPEERAKSSQD